MLKSLSTVAQVADALVEIQVKSTRGLIEMVSQTPPASNMLPTTPNLTTVRLSTNAKTAPGQYAQSAKLAKTNAGLLITRSITFPTITLSMESTR